ncbi:hypothetical protein DL96DRAFT_1779961 [Flagelloscypha sp. PMI_526]|nr:hypothetical protein DL96DRAFT_1779961 [Flagelloscypha sp. PMI_526]
MSTARNTLDLRGCLTLTNSTATSDWLLVQRWDTCSGNPSFLKITNSPNPLYTYISFQAGTTSCTALDVNVGNHGSGSPGWSQDSTETFCGETMIMDFHEDVLSPRWRNPNSGKFFFFLSHLPAHLLMIWKDMVNLTFYWAASTGTLGASLTPYVGAAATGPVDVVFNNNANLTQGANATTTQPANGKSNSKAPILPVRGAIVGGVVGGLALFILLGIALWINKDRLRAGNRASNDASNQSESQQHQEKKEPPPAYVSTPANNINVEANRSRQMFDNFDSQGQ